MVTDRFTLFEDDVVLVDAEVFELTAGHVKREDGEVVVLGNVVAVMVVVVVVVVAVLQSAI